MENLEIIKRSKHQGTGEKNVRHSEVSLRPKLWHYGVLFHILCYYWGEENRSLHRSRKQILYGIVSTTNYVYGRLRRTVNVPRNVDCCSVARADDMKYSIVASSTQTNKSKI